MDYYTGSLYKNGFFWNALYHKLKVQQSIRNNPVLKIKEFTGVLYYNVSLGSLLKSYQTKLQKKMSYACLCYEILLHI